MLRLAKRLVCRGIFPVSLHDVSPLWRVASDLSLVRHGADPDKGTLGLGPDDSGDLATWNVELA